MFDVAKTIEIYGAVMFSDEQLRAAKQIALMLHGLNAELDEQRDWMVVSTPKTSAKLNDLALLMGYDCALCVFAFVQSDCLETLAKEFPSGSKQLVITKAREGLEEAYFALFVPEVIEARTQRVRKLQDFMGSLQVAA
ncbi:hypothetical protein [Pseudovibrio sp. Tun.PSC04-5.I4]|uniref:hypothetical protein n=1 Tax=Pseudovibrio sp. Tun.PSC04-5.I4 TaxID=1798213 RepID=UPI00087EE8BB|nr:hypothetical protein [Pseudovibrio sp. Tun.PSC04-5.I4]SDQ99441.1 hypothetical protein SAMN04515695_2222 [Pseudovibrio sp. Tun.PSC04-5.I4]